MPKKQKSKYKKNKKKTKHPTYWFNKRTLVQIVRGIKLQNLWYTHKQAVLLAVNVIGVSTFRVRVIRFVCFCITGYHNLVAVDCFVRFLHAQNLIRVTKKIKRC